MAVHLTEKEIDEIRLKHYLGQSQVSLAKEYGCCRNTIISKTRGINKGEGVVKKTKIIPLPKTRVYNLKPTPEHIQHEIIIKYVCGTFKTVLQKEYKLSYHKVTEIVKNYIRGEML